MQECPCASPHGPLLPVAPLSPPRCPAPNIVILSEAKEPFPKACPLRFAQGDSGRASVNRAHGTHSGPDTAATSPAAAPASTAQPQPAATHRCAHDRPTGAL